MPEITITEGESAAKADFTLTYGPDWSVAAKRNTPVLKSDLAATGVYFHVKATAGGAAWLTFTDANSAQIEWLDQALGKIRVHFPETTEGRVADQQPYELRLKFSDGKWLTAESGVLNVKESTVDTP